ncbi:hypothetical protein [Hydrogenimonas cancrithermarum]|uniref:Uncharacterized protein n=1 Tax=Hydrogenimonas cancrithermarum TaxID=2993563 RepID=A0ABM8FK58_9BACT|nr:hypothetical protein [Hydrogenimonas cancrithermarum]BDY12707.1 hypothetical protein HCR_10190 [Hydrogenimonas cancrithermarum]
MQSSRMVYALLALLLLAGMAIFAWTNPSYEKAFEAKWHYLMGEYDEAYTLAKEAYELDRYNRMAFTVMTQTEVAKRFIDYIREGEAYLRQIETIADHPPISDADRMRIKLMCEVMMERYEKLAPTKLTEKELVERARDMYEKFQNLYRSLFQRHP